METETKRARRGWIEVRVVVPIGWEELIAGELALDACSSVAFGRPNLVGPAAPEGTDYVRTFFAAEDDTPELRDAVAERLATVASRAGAPELAGLEPTFHSLPPEDWATSWRKSWKPFRVGHLCVVTHDWDRPRRPGDVLMRLEPGGAFGTGRHATTRTCLRTLQELDLAGARALDAGTGSGILAVAAAMCGAKLAIGFDIDPRSSREAGDLANDNGVADRTEFRTGDFSVLTDDDRDFDLVLANIYSDVLQATSAELAERMAPGGRFLFSGCPDRHGAATTAAIRAAGLEIDELRQRGRWLTFLGHL
ncbi:50S ribosomal protein L11 methyltransferase [Engelhardtia mirabilis]|uniref:Ribosomal protein L11 methyltransferase n=1 Tax=Engelhardtia mirabilis TaxID=2528011 RepID=A0A518BFJ3_9BACT|nr:Ribosomal protein L11 methyltransferase [Planctomycetes bacterium Pla133]QDV00080.1 Ribosomal protein L11 methyltransferase [Planctomycetes bacterium Pla86]